MAPGVIYTDGHELNDGNRHLIDKIVRGGAQVLEANVAKGKARRRVREIEAAIRSTDLQARG
ncbi:hypothetical protein Rmf_04290 [Roseomonas fluvialis]|uniref:Uncharacterized protein n=1 Tax=Roseomonas fluvialis TaxID=1750527 RepID=A0ABM7XYF7_9PROT|nr:hypothetical protein Rmf_04290 [Roseomonas fluvialis]